MVKPMCFDKYTVARRQVKVLVFYLARIVSFIHSEWSKGALQSRVPHL